MNNKLQMILLALAFSIVTGCQSVANQNSKDKSVAATSSVENNQTTFEMAEISKHNQKNDCWLLIEGQVYDVTNFIKMHPGGEAILQGCGIDATNLYKTRPMGSGTPHSQNANNRLQQYLIGKLKP